MSNRGWVKFSPLSHWLQRNWQPIVMMTALVVVGGVIIQTFGGMPFLMNILGRENKFSLKSRKVVDVERVFMHTADDYTVFEAKGFTLEPRRFWAGGGASDKQTIEIRQDAEPGGPMQLEILQFQGSNNFSHRTDYILHLHSAKEIGGGDYQLPGRSYQRGKTIPLE